jgi:dolichol-phosphate mannosyltransferase
MKISVVIPAHNEEGCLYETVSNIVETLAQEGIEHEVLIVNDNSKDSTLNICQHLSQTFKTVRYVNNEPPNGFGFAVRRGLDEFAGDAVAIMMADASDDPRDLVAGYYQLLEGYDCVFGSRFAKGGKVVDYPVHKLVINRLANWFIKTLFGLPYNDITNAFKIYRREVIVGYVFSVLLGYFIFRESISLTRLIGLSFIVSGVILVIWQKN